MTTSNQQEMLQIIPAIDLWHGQVVRLYQGKYDQVSVYSDDPASQAKAFQKAGAKLLHIVDLNAARSGKRQENAKAIQDILQAVNPDGPMKVELGGGIRSMDALRECFELGVHRCILGTAAVKDPQFLEASLNTYGANKIIVGVDARNQIVQVSGWEEQSALKVEDFLKDLQSTGVSTIIFTDISRDGTLEGPGQALEHYIESCDLQFILSGGLSSLEDLEAILKKHHPRLVGVISGRAIYEKKLDLRKAVEMCKSLSQ